MSDDLVKWLRDNPHQGRTEMLKLRAEIERLRGAGDAMAIRLKHIVGREDVVAAWEDARAALGEGG